MLTVDTSAAETDLVELGAVKAELGILDASQDAKLAGLIAAASETIAEYLGFLPWRQSYTETVAGKGTPELLLSQMPVQQVTSVTLNSTLITDYVLEDASAGILWRDGHWTWHPFGVLPVDYHPAHGPSRRNVSVEYTAGWLLPGEVDRDLPQAIEQAALETVLAWYGDGTGPSASSVGPLESLRIGATTETYAGAEATATAVRQYAIPARALALLHGHRRASW